MSPTEIPTPTFHGAERRRIGDDRRWERTKVYLSVAGQAAIALAGLWISISLERFKDSQQAETKRIEYRASFYNSVKDDLNSVYSFACRIGDYSTVSPTEIANKKRMLDRRFAENIPFMSLDTNKAYHSLIQLISRGSNVEGKHFRFVGIIEKYKIAYDNRRKERGNLANPQQNPPPTVNDNELQEWLTNTAHDAVKIQLAYATLLSSVGRDSNFPSLDADAVAEQLICFED